jgi:hypothetical protein
MVDNWRGKTSMPELIVVASFPRSGTHLLIDFLRRNFMGTNIKLPIWKSSAYLYHDLDNPKIPAVFFADRIKDGHCIIVKTHSLRPDQTKKKLLENYPGRSFITLLPFRRFERTLSSFAAFCFAQSESPSNGEIEDILTKDLGLYFQNSRSAIENIKLHNKRWQSFGAFPVSIENMLNDPVQSAEAISERIALPLLNEESQVPRQKALRGKTGELIERLRGRESTEVKIALEYQLSRQEAERVHTDLDELYCKLRNDAINQNEISW